MSFSTTTGLTHYLVAIQLPDDFDPSLQTEATIRDITALNEELDVKDVAWLSPAGEDMTTRDQVGHGALHDRRRCCGPPHDRTLRVINPPRVACRSK